MSPARGWRGLALSLVLSCVAATGASGASIAEHRVDLTLNGDEYIQQESLVVRITSEADLRTWEYYPIFLSERDALIESRAEVISAEGRVIRKIPRRDFEKIQSPGSGLYSSDAVLRVPFGGIQVGEELHMSFKTRRRPVYPATSVLLSEASRQENLRVRVSGSSFRWHLRGAGEFLRVTASPDSGDSVLEIVGEGVPDLDFPPWSPSVASAAPALLLTWGKETEWSQIGEWYQRISSGLPTRSSEVASKARELIAGKETPRQQLEALVGYVKDKIRYEAVEIGVGGWVPSPSGEVLGRGWGDCKDKSELLVQLMAEAGIPAHLALLRAGFGQRIEQDFPSPFQFNHAIVAIPAAAVSNSEEDPVSGGYLFVDPTSEQGGVRWLTPASQGRHALVVEGTGGRLVRTPQQSEDDGRVLRVEGRVSEEGVLEGVVEYRLQGSRALPWLRDLKERSLDRTLEDLQRVVHRVAPGAEVTRAGFKKEEAPVPGLRLFAKVRLPGAVRGEAGRRWLRLGSLGSLPGSRELADREGMPVALAPGFNRTEWKLTLPKSWCPAKISEGEAVNPVGRVRSRTGPAEGVALWVERETRIHQRWVEAESLPALRELAIAENRFAKRRVRLECPQPEVSK